jgi:lipoprotein-anchoring transpeptidase ErfK/SrfK
MRFNIGFTPGTAVSCAAARRTPTINHAPAPFIENKRYRPKPPPVGGMVNRKAGSVYQTEAVLILVGGVRGAFESGRLEDQFQQDETVQSTSMFRRMTLALLASASCLGAGLDQAQAVEAAAAGEPTVIYADQSAPPPAPVRLASAERAMGGGFIEFLFGDGPNQGERYQQQPDYQRPVYREPAYRQPGYPQPDYYQPQSYQPQGALLPQQEQQQEEAIDPRQRPFDPRFEKQLVDYHGTERPGTIVVDTPNKFLFLVQGDGKALRYGIGVGKPGFTWSGVKTISAKKEWPDWTPPAEMLVRRPDLPRHMEGGPQNPLGARAMYLGSSLYRIHGSNEPWTIGTNVSSGCIRMRNEDVIDLYGRVNVGARVVVI